MPGPQQNDPGQLRQWVLTEWTQHLCAAIESMTGEVAVPEESAAPAAAAGTHVWKQGYSLSPDAWAWVSAPSQTWNAIGGKALEAAGIDDATEADRRGTYQEILNQAMSGLAGSMARHAGVEVFCQNGKEGGDPPDAARWLSISAGTAAPCPIGLHISDGLISALRGEPAPAPAPAPPKPQAPAAAPPQAPVSSPASGPLTAPPPPAPPPAPSGRGQTIELLYDVELPVSVSFGRANLPLKEVLKLTSGSIVELNRSVTEPVEVIVNNCVVARGEVVVVEGNYGVRILQIISQRERLRTVR